MSDKLDAVGASTANRYLRAKYDLQMVSLPFLLARTIVLISLQARSSALELENVGDKRVAVVDVDVS
jgi:hypothetical protein